MVWDSDKVVVSDYELGAFSLFIVCCMHGMGNEWLFSGVYGLNVAGEMDSFLVG